MNSGAIRTKRVCLITPAHFSMHPRIVKEADTLSEAGYEVRVCACQFSDLGTETDRMILRRAKWRASLLCLRPNKGSYLFLKSQLRQRFFRLLIQLLQLNRLPPSLEKLAWFAYDRVLPELLDLVLAEPADLYIAHDLRALPIAVTAARLHKTKSGFDAEDFYSGKKWLGKASAFTQTLKEYIEQRYLTQCDYMTAGSPDIAEAYTVKYGVAKPVFLLNVFPLSQRPWGFRRGTRNSPLSLYWFSQTIGARRGLEDVVHAMSILRGCPIHLHLRGNWQRGYRKKLFRLAEEVGLSPRQIIVHPPGAPDEMVRLASQFDIGLALEPGLSENNQIALSNKLFTYLLAGNAVIATTTKSQRALVQDLGSAAYCYEPGDVKALAHRLRVWLDDRESLEESRRQAWDWGTRQYNWDLEKKKFLQVVEEVLGCDLTLTKKDGVLVR